MANEFRKVTDQNGVDHPICDDTRVAWADAGKSVKKNKMVFDVQATSQNNVTLTINSDNTYTVNTGSGGASGLTTIRVGYITEAGQYRLNGCPEGGGDSTYRLDVRPNGSTTPMSGSVDTGTGSAVINVTSGDLPASVTMRIPSGATISNKLFKPMVRNADIVDDTFEKTIPDNTELMTWEANAKTGVHNQAYFIAGCIGAGSEPNSYRIDTSIGSSVVAKVSQNTNYKFSKLSGQGDRCRVVLFKNEPSSTATTDALQVFADNTAHEGSFNSGVYNYAVFTYDVQSTRIPQDTAKAMIYLAEDTVADYAPYAMTNRELTEEIKLTPTADGTIVSEIKYNDSVVIPAHKIAIINMTIKIGTYADWTTALSGLPKPAHDVYVPMFDRSNPSTVVHGSIFSSGNMQLVKAGSGGASPATDNELTLSVAYQYASLT